MIYVNNILETRDYLLILPNFSVHLKLFIFSLKSKPAKDF